MSDGARLHEVLDRLSTWEEVEVYAKTGRSRGVRYTPQGVVTSFREEAGWAVRAGDARRSFFHAQTGDPDPDAAWPEADGYGLRLPSVKGTPSWAPPPDLDAPLLSENEGRAFFEALGRELDRELPGARVVLGEIEDGASESRLVSSRDVEAEVRQRAALVYLEASRTLRGRRPKSVTLRLAEREARRFHAPALARRLADRLAIAERGTAPPRDRGEFLLAPAVMAAMVDVLTELWLGPEAVKKVSPLTDRRGRIASLPFTLIDDGRFPGGVLETPLDGEGQPTREVVLVEEGLFRQPLLAWWQSTPSTGRPSGCTRRASWRDLPRPGPTHLYVKPNPEIGVATLVEDLARGYYLLDTEGVPRLEGGRFAIPVGGFAIDAGRPVGAVSGAWLVGSVASFLHDLVAAARDLSFVPSSRGMLGSPTMRVKGLELRQRLDRPRRVFG